MGLQATLYADHRGTFNPDANIRTDISVNVQGDDQIGVHIQHATGNHTTVASLKFTRDEARALAAELAGAADR